MTEMDIIMHLTRRIDERKYPWQVPRSFIYGWESDYWACGADGIAREFEIKISRSDYFNDAKKDKWQQELGANYFYYVVPKDLIQPDEVDKRYGLVYVWDTGHLEFKKKPRLLHDKKFDNWKMLANKMYWKWRQLWKDKYVGKELTIQEYQKGFIIELTDDDYHPCPVCNGAKLLVRPEIKKEDSL